MRLFTRDEHLQVHLDRSASLCCQTLSMRKEKKKRKMSERSIRFCCVRSLCQRLEKYVFHWPIACWSFLSHLSTSTYVISATVNRHDYARRLLSSARVFSSGDRCNIDLFDLCVKNERKDTFCHSKPFLSRRRIGLSTCLIWPSNVHEEEKNRFGLELIENCALTDWE